MKPIYSKRHVIALTLLELLCVIAIIAILLGLLLPSLSSNKERASKAMCLNNLKQMGLAMRLYSGDNGQRYPSDAAWTTLGSYGLLTNNYQTEYKTWICPQDKSRSVGSARTAFTAGNLSYAYAAFGLTETVQPNTPLAADRSVDDIRSVTPWINPRNNHPGEGGNILYADGHVERRMTLDPPMYRGKNP